MKNQDIIFASLMGSKIVKTIPRFGLIQNEMQKHVLPQISFELDQRESRVTTSDFEAYPGSGLADQAPDESQQFFPFKMSIDGENWFMLPYEPMISISGKNNIVKRNVAKSNGDEKELFIGTIKERWSQDDYNITITGFLIGSIMSGKVEECFPREDFEKLRKLLTHTKELYVQCPPLELLGITRIAVEDFTFPFTKGENVQAYEIKVVSDFKYNLLIAD